MYFGAYSYTLKGIMIDKGDHDWRVSGLIFVHQQYSICLSNRSQTQNNKQKLSIVSQIFRWGFVIHGGIDGYSRKITFLQCNSLIILCHRVIKYSKSP